MTAGAGAGEFETTLGGSPHDKDTMLEVAMTMMMIIKMMMMMAAAAAAAAVLSSNGVVVSPVRHVLA